MIWNPTALNNCAPSLDSVPGGSLDSFSVASSDGRGGVSSAGLAAHLRPVDKWGMQPNVFDSPQHAHVLEKQVRPHPTLSDAAYPEPPGWLVMAEAVAEWLAPAPPKGRGNTADLMAMAIAWPRRFHAAVALGRSMLVFGGRVLGPAGGGVSSDLLLYVPPEEGPREVRGPDGLPFPPDSPEALAEEERKELAKAQALAPWRRLHLDQTARPLSAAGTARVAHAMTVLNGVVYVFGGETADGEILGELMELQFARVADDAPLTLPVRRRPRNAVPSVGPHIPFIRPERKKQTDDDFFDRAKKNDDANERRKETARVVFTFPASEWSGSDGRKTMVIQDLEKLVAAIGYKNCFVLTTNGIECAKTVMGFDFPPSEETPDTESQVDEESLKLSLEDIESQSKSDLDSMWAALSGETVPSKPVVERKKSYSDLI